MSSRAGFLDFFILEATDYVEQLDGLLAKAASGGLDAEPFQRVARALRGAATMARMPAMADLAGALERVGRALREGGLAWEPAISAVLVAAIDDLKLLLRATRSWGPAEDQRATTRAGELARYAPERATASSTPSATAGTTFFSSEAANIAAGLELLTARPDDRDSAANVLRRVRALRGVAGIKELPLLAEVLEGAEQAARSLELGEASLPASAVALLTSAAGLLRRIATTLREGGSPTEAPERDEFVSSLDAYRADEGGSERIVPIAELFYRDAGPHLVSAAPNPPTSPVERFRLELVSQGEHLRGLVAEARQTSDDGSRERLRRELQRTLDSLRVLAEGFGETETAATVASHIEAARRLDPAGLDSLEAMGSVLAERGGRGGQFAERFAAPKPGRSTQPVSSTAPTPVMTPAIRSTLATTPPRRAPTPPTSLSQISGEVLSTALDDSISGIDALRAAPLAEPAALDEQAPVPIEALLYRGPAAIERAIEIRDALRRRDGEAAADTLEELFDLLDLARVG